MADKDLRIAIIGAGMGGLACALSCAKKGFKHIDVFETASNLGFVGAGIQLAPNMARILDRLGCWADIEKDAVDIKSTSIRQGDSDTELAHVDLRYIRQNYDYPHMVGHRSSLAGSLYAACKQEADITFHFSTSVSSISSFGPTPTFTAQPRNGEPYEVTSDVLLAADGVKSNIRPALLDRIDKTAQVVETNQAAYRIMLSREDMQHDAELLALLDADAVTRWVGEKRHVIAYPVANKTIYNISTIQPDVNFAAAPSATYTTKGSKPAMMRVFDDFCPKVKRLLDLVPDGDVCEWKLRVHGPLPTWVHGSVALVGDACHPTLPHLAQGAAQAIEDGAVIGEVLALLPEKSPESINRTLRVYEAMRKERAETLVDLAAQAGRALHLGEGKAKEERDRIFRELREKGDGQARKVPDKWADAEVQKMVYGVDIMEETKKQFQTLYDGFVSETNEHS